MHDELAGADMISFQCVLPAHVDSNLGICAFLLLHKCTGMCRPKLHARTALQAVAYLGFLTGQ